MPTGMLRIDINTNISSLNGQRLARQGPGNFLNNATRFLVNERGLGDGDFISVTQGPGSTPALLFVADAQRLPGNAFSLRAPGAKAPKKRGKKAARKTTKKPAKKTTKAPAKRKTSKKTRKSSKKKSKKSASKGSGSKKTAKKSSKK